MNILVIQFYKFEFGIYSNSYSLYLLQIIESHGLTLSIYNLYIYVTGKMCEQNINVSIDPICQKKIFIIVC